MTGQFASLVFAAPPKLRANGLFHLARFAGVSGSNDRLRLFKRAILRFDSIDTAERVWISIAAENNFGETKKLKETVDGKGPAGERWTRLPELLMRFRAAANMSCEV